MKRIVPQRAIDLNNINVMVIKKLKLYVHFDFLIVLYTCRRFCLFLVEVNSVAMDHIILEISLVLYSAILGIEFKMLLNVTLKISLVLYRVIDPS